MLQKRNKKLFNLLQIKNNYFSSLDTSYELGASIKNKNHQITMKKPKIEVRNKFSNNFQLKIKTKNPKVIIDQGWHQ